jgi:hypothetical protein
MFAWISGFLNHRTQQVIIRNCLSKNICITSGVPQGSVLGPTLFLLYINDLADVFVNLNCVVKLYADDAKLYSSYKSGDHLSSFGQSTGSISGLGQNMAATNC